MKRSVRSVVLAATAGAVVAVSLAGVPAASGASLPMPGDQCKAKDFWEEIPVKNTQKDPSKPPQFVKVKSNPKAAHLVCVPLDWNPEMDLKNLSTSGLWQWDPATFRWPWDPENYKPDPAHDPCRLEAKYPKYSNLGFSDRSSFVPTVGQVKGLVLTFATQESFDTQFYRASSASYYEYGMNRYMDDQETLADFLETYYWNTSRGRLNMSIDVDRTFHIATGPLRPGRDNSGDWDIETLLPLVDEDVDFSGIDFVIFNGIETGRPYARNGGNFGSVTLDGSTIQNVFNVFASSSAIGEFMSERKKTWAHEMGHLFGLPDLYAEPPNAPGHRFALGKSLMESSLASGLSGYERWILGWMPTDKVRCREVGEKKSTYVNMSSVDSLGGRPSMVMFPVPGVNDRLRVVEFRANEGQTTGFVEPGLLTYEINSRPTTAHNEFSAYDTESEPFGAVPFLAYRDDWTTINGVQNPDPNNAEAVAQYERWFTETFTNGANLQPVRKPGDEPHIWRDPDVFIDNLRITQPRRGGLNAGFWYGTTE